MTNRLRRVLAAVLSPLMRSRFAHRWLAPHLASAQLRLHRLSRGRVQLSSILVPSLILVTVGAKSGLRRETPLMCWPEAGGSYLVSGSNWGRPQHPGWTANLIAHPDAEVIFRRGHVPVTAVLMAGVEREALWSVLEAQWPDYRSYEATAGREIRIFRLQPR